MELSRCVIEACFHKAGIKAQSKSSSDTTIDEVTTTIAALRVNQLVTVDNSNERTGAMLIRQMGDVQNIKDADDDCRGMMEESINVVMG